MARSSLSGRNAAAHMAVTAAIVAAGGVQPASAQLFGRPASPAQSGDDMRNNPSILRPGSILSPIGAQQSSPLPAGSILPPINWSHPQRMGPELPGIVPLSPSQMPAQVYRDTGNSWNGAYQYGGGFGSPYRRRPVYGTYNGGQYGEGGFDRGTRPDLPVLSGRPSPPPSPTTDVLHATEVRVTTPAGERRIDRDRFDRDYVYGGGGMTVITDGPVLLGGYYYGNYCSSPYGYNCYPSAFSYYSGFPGYIYNPSVIVLSQPYTPAYATPYMPFYAPTYEVSYNENNYYVGDGDTADSIREGGDTAKRALKEAFPSNSYQAAFADIERAWNDGNIELLRKHLRDADTKVAVSLKSKYRYSIASSDLEQISKDAFDRLTTVSFKFSRLRKAKNGDVTAFAKHVYRGQDDQGPVSADGTVPFDTDSPPASQSDSSSETDKTIYVSYTLRKRDDMWYIIAVDSSKTPLTSDQTGSES